MADSSDLGRRRRWFAVHVIGVVAWVGAMGATILTARQGIACVGWAALALAGLAGLRGGVSLLAPRGSSNLMDADPRKSGNAVDGYTASGPVGTMLWLAIAIGLAGAVWTAIVAFGVS